MTRGQKATAAQAKYHNFFFGIRSGTKAYELLPQLQETIPVSDLTSFRDAFYLQCRIIGSEREKYWNVAAAMERAHFSI
jgi:hypothetical protein